ncbi:hypothetical protein [Pseudomonas prosekii]|uniref:hypothetical protein n=1 Tax=Pseudomonas prosekii TaxID=1148509 RepID=UPI003F74B510
MVANVLESVSEKNAGHYRLCEGFSYAGAPFDFFIVKPGRGESPQFVPSSFLDTYYSDANRYSCLNGIVLRIIECPNVK